MMSIDSPRSTSSMSSRRRSKFLPLSNHGMPKTPAPKSPGGSFRPHRFSNAGSAMQFSPPMSPMSPPMSAKSFGTFIDSEPSTPAYSPRMGAGWESSTLMLLSPRLSAPATPTEPEWDMLAPTPKYKEEPPLKLSPVPLRAIHSGTSLSSHPVQPIDEPIKRTQESPMPILNEPVQPIEEPIKRTQESFTNIPKDLVKPSQEESMKENLPPPPASETEEGQEGEGESEPKPQEDTTATTAPLGKLATRMKSMLRRKPASEKKGDKKRRQYEELDRMEDVHWTEM